MPNPTLQRAALALTLAAGIGLGSAASPRPAEPVSYTFRESPLNSLGIKSLADLRGKPVVIDFWGRN